MCPQILLVNPPIYDFSAFDFWLRPYGLLRIGGFLRGLSTVTVFDFLDRAHPSLPEAGKNDEWGCGKFYSEKIPTPAALSFFDKPYRRYGIPRREFQKYLCENGPFDFVLLGSTMTYWYPGVEEVITDIRELCPTAKIAVGGTYATLCPDHAKTLGADLVVNESDLTPLWELLNTAIVSWQPPLWEQYNKLDAAVIKLTEGCPFNCSYCSVRQHYPTFTVRSLESVMREAELLSSLGTRHLAFYDDALLAQDGQVLRRFLGAAERYDLSFAYHTPNAIHARFVDNSIAALMKNAGFQKLFLGVESSSEAWLKKSGNKVSVEDVKSAVACFKNAGFDSAGLTAYVLLGHPEFDADTVESAIEQVHQLGIKVMMSEFSPIPGTKDGELCREWIDLDEPLLHNKAVFPEVLLGREEVERLKRLCREANSAL